MKRRSKHIEPLPVLSWPVRRPCPSGVHYMHLWITPRDYIEKRYKTPFSDRALRWFWRVSPALSHNAFRLALLGAKIGRPLRGLMPDARLRAMLEDGTQDIPRSARNDDPAKLPRPRGSAPKGWRLMTGCAQKARTPISNDATIRLPDTGSAAEVSCRRRGVLWGAGPINLAKTSESHATAARATSSVVAEMDGRGSKCIVIKHVGRGTTVKELRPQVPANDRWRQMRRGWRDR